MRFDSKRRLKAEGRTVWSDSRINVRWTLGKTKNPS